MIPPRLVTMQQQLEEIAKAQASIKIMSMTYQLSAKLRVAAHYGLRFSEVDLPYPQWAALWEKYKLETEG